jgi:hypothetical protein
MAARAEGNGLMGLRKWIRELRSQYRRGELGVPEGVSVKFLEELCLERLGSPLAEVRHRHLSAWKASGSYQLKLLAQNKQRLALIAKEARYTPDEIPALVGLGIRPGAPEFAVLGCPGSELLPGVFHCEEIAANEHYSYIMEDLSDEYRMADDERDVVFLAGQLPRLHANLPALFSEVEPRGLIQYDGGFSHGLLKYAAKQLSDYVTRFPNPQVESLCSLLPDLSSLRMTILSQRQDFGELQPIHGDFNSSNAMIHKGTGAGIKLIDWEWAGYGLPHADLASLLKSASAEVQQKALTAYIEADPSCSAAEHKLLYQWAQLERAVLDASFLGAQRCLAKHEAHLDLDWCVENSSRIAATCYGLIQRQFQADLKS